MEFLAVSVRKNPAISGLSIPRVPDLPVLSLYADDTSVVVTSDQAIVAVFETYHLFEEASGAKINLNKCEGLWLGSWRHRLDAPVGIRWNCDKIKVLGVFIGPGNLEEANWRPRIDAIKNCLSSWRSRSLSYKGKALVINALMAFWYFDRFGASPMDIISSPFDFQPSLLPPFYCSLLKAWRTLVASFRPLLILWLLVTLLLHPLPVSPYTIFQCSLPPLCRKISTVVWRLPLVCYMEAT